MPTEVPRLLEARCRVDVFEGFFELLVMDALQPVLVEVVPGGDDEVDVQLLANLPHLHEKEKKKNKPNMVQPAPIFLEILVLLC
ncbi:hypothetical protein JBE27_54695 [Streptomyces albiflaviniger]|nr:hypothetical protein [Streptomyces albiflaviniger]